MPSHQQVAENKAQDRWETALRLTFAEAYPAAVELIDEALRKAATAAEMRRRGDGLRVILERLPPESPNTGLPPADAAPPIPGQVY